MEPVPVLCDKLTSTFSNSTEELIASIKELTEEVREQKCSIDAIKTSSEEMLDLLLTVSMEVLPKDPLSVATEFAKKLSSIEKKVDSTALVLEGAVVMIADTVQILATLAPSDS